YQPPRPRRGPVTRTARRKLTRSDSYPSSKTYATRATRQYADTWGVRGVIPPPERSEGKSTHSPHLHALVTAHDGLGPSDHIRVAVVHADRHRTRIDGLVCLTPGG